LQELDSYFDACRIGTIPISSYCNHHPTETVHKKLMKNLIVMCPEVTTGGPEALHQLSKTANELGINALMAYYGEKSKIMVSSDHMHCVVDCPNHFSKRYSKYGPRTQEKIKLGENSMVIFPESEVRLAMQWKQSKKAIWWLSVDNFKRLQPELDYESEIKKICEDRGTLHLYQSAYARDFLMKSNCRRILPLHDYTSEIYIEELSCEMHTEKATDIAFFPKKGGDLAKAFITGHGREFSYKAIHGMTPEEVKQTLGSSKIFLDFGHHPGKDRVPREAACMGCIVLLHEKGAARYFEDHALDDFYLFTQRDIEDGSLAERVKNIISAQAASQQVV